MKFISIIMGSGSDLDIANEAVKVLESFGVKYEMIVSSAQRSPQRTHDYVVAAQNKGCEAFICNAGMADRKSTRLNSSHRVRSRMPSSA